MRFTVFGLILMIVIAFFSQSQAQNMNRRGTVMISTNPLKWIYCIPNFEIEYYFASSVSVQLCSEYLLSDWVVKRDKHPDFVSRVGVRYHLCSDKDFGDKHDPYLGTYFGNSWSKSFPEKEGFNLGLEGGYKYQLTSLIYLNTKVLLTYNVKEAKILPGFECLFGYILKK